MAVQAFAASFWGKHDALATASMYLDDLPAAIMLCDPQNFLICYANKSSIELLKTIQHILPIPAEDIIGASIDVFHKAPEHQRKMLSRSPQLPHTALIRAGGEALELKINAVRDARGNYRYAQLTWSVVTKIIEQQKKTDNLLNMIEELPIKRHDLHARRVPY